MSKFEVKMPKLGESITEGTIVTLNVKVGDMVEDDQVLFEVTTAKVNAEVPSPVSGKVLSILFGEGDTVAVGKTVLVLSMDGEDDSDATEQMEVGTKEENAEITTSSETEQTPTQEATPKKIEPATPQQKEISDEPPAQNTTQEKTVSKAQNADRWYSPVVLSMAKQANINSEELDQIQGTGYLGRLSKKDLKNHIENKRKQSASPKPQTDSAPQSQKQTPPPVADYSKGNVEIKDMDAVGKIISDRMISSRRTSAHVTTVVEVDVTKLVNWRSKHKEDFKKQEGINLTYLPAIVESTVKALKEFPKLNASIDGYKYILKKDINMGIAVALDDGNLVVPVIHGADKLNISGIAHAVENLSTKARSNKLTMPEIENGTFTITNFGTFKNIIGTPIINQPEVAILGVGFIEKKPAVIETPEGDVIAIRHKMYLSLSYDHRLINGAVGGAFLLKVAENLENWNVD